MKCGCYNSKSILNSYNLSQTLNFSFNTTFTNLFNPFNNEVSSKVIILASVGNYSLL